ncbi:cytochrome P450 704C1-like [Rosa rugosa]|uniref:cytochrome P450 704C1-like n=1 Tax=Rosa rugosa TaxID=74645 RepID=UPI002B4169FA|nr:cytochrome P450 704C1-like [Rosa rugosa]
MSVMDFFFISLHPISISLAAILIAIYMVRPHARRLYEKRKRYHPVAGTVLNQLINFPRLHHYMTELACKYTTYRLLGFFRSEIYTSDPANVEYMLKTNFPNYGKGLYHHSILSDIAGDSIFTVDGESWRHQRKLSSYEFSTKVMRDFSHAVFKTNAVKLAQIISEAVSCDQAIEIQDLFMKSSLDSIVRILLGIELDTMSGTNEEGIRFSYVFNEANEFILYRYVDFFWKIKRFLNIGSEAVLKNHIKVIDQFMYKLIKSKMDAVHKSEDRLPLKKRDFISRLLEMKETNPKYIKDMGVNFIIAGKDTVATTLSWLFYMLCKYPRIQEKIAQEVREATNLKDNSSVDELAASLTEEVLDKMQYLHAALTETLRLYPAVPVNAKVCFSDDTWPDGFSVKKGDMVAYQPYAMGRMKFLWGDDAEEFRPERWLDENDIFQPESPFKFTVFQAGPRICLGKEFAYKEMKIFSAVLLGNYIFKLSEKKTGVNYRTMINLHIDGGLFVLASPRLELERS